MRILFWGEMVFLSAMVVVSQPSLAHGQVNIALGKRATQSSTGFGGVASRAVDGKTDGNYSHHSVSHTKKQNHAWWEVDLGSVHTISKVVFYNRTDCCGERLNNVDVIVYDARRRIAGKRSIGVAHRINRVRLSVSGRYVRIQLRGKHYLSLTEVRVFGSKKIASTSGKNIALGKQATQSSTGYSGIASRAVDGKTDGNHFHHSVSHTKKQNHAWWEVDLGSVHTISKVVFYNRTDCCGERLNNVDVIVYDARRRVVGKRSVGVAHRINRVRLSVSGRYVRIQLRGKNYLSLTEVRVFGPGKITSPQPPSR